MSVDTAILLGVTLVVALTRYFGPVCCLTPTRPPELPLVLGVMLMLGLIIAITSTSQGQRLSSLLVLFLLIIIFIVLKSEPLSISLSAALRSLQGQDAQLASAIDVRWLGYSYLAFRLMHVLRDRQQGKPHDYSLSEFVSYCLFFPALTAGPIDRSERFMGDIRLSPPLDAAETFDGGQRVLVGIFKKFVLADSLAIFALNPINAAQTSSTIWTWVLLYAYALRIYLDFAGYTDIALGTARWLGIKLPENFSAPYITTNITAFWNSWHITLAQWFRAYFFNPVTRALRSKKLNLPVWLVIFVGQAGTMLLIGLWHGVTWNFAIWGLWHAVGLFAHNRWSDWMRPRMASLEQRIGLTLILSFISWVITFHYVTLGWVWFALPGPKLAIVTMTKLFGY